MKTSHILSVTTLAGILAAQNSHAAVAMSTTLVDIADGKPTFGDVAFGAATSNGNDGNTSSGNWTHADFPGSATPYPGEVANAPNPYWEVDLQGSFALDSFVVTDRTGTCCSDPNRLNGSTVTLFGAGGSVVGTETLNVVNGVFGSVLNFNNGGAGYAGVERVRIDGLSTNQYFQFSEFDALIPVTGPVNWALNAGVGYFNGSDTAVGTWAGTPAENINDGNLTSFSHALDMATNDYYAQVDLGQEILIDNVSLTGRTGCCPDRLADYAIEFRDAAGNLVHTSTHTGQTVATENFDIIGEYGGNGPSAQFVRVVNISNNAYGPQIAELEVFGAIPEPGSSMLLLVASALLLRRRR